MNFLKKPHFLFFLANFSIGIFCAQAAFAEEKVGASLNYTNQELRRPIGDTSPITPSRSKPVRFFSPITDQLEPQIQKVNEVRAGLRAHLIAREVFEGRAVSAEDLNFLNANQNLIFGPNTNLQLLQANYNKDPNLKLDHLSEIERTIDILGDESVKLQRLLNESDGEVGTKYIAAERARQARLDALVIKLQTDEELKHIPELKEKLAAWAEKRAKPQPMNSPDRITNEEFSKAELGAEAKAQVKANVDERMRVLDKLDREGVRELVPTRNLKPVRLDVLGSVLKKDEAEMTRLLEDLTEVTTREATEVRSRFSISPDQEEKALASLKDAKSALASVSQNMRHEYVAKDPEKGGPEFLYEAHRKSIVAVANGRAQKLKQTEKPSGEEVKLAEAQVEALKKTIERSYRQRGQALEDIVARAPEPEIAAMELLKKVKMGEEQLRRCEIPTVTSRSQEIDLPLIRESLIQSHIELIETKNPIRSKVFRGDELEMRRALESVRPSQKSIDYLKSFNPFQKAADQKGEAK